VGAETKRCTVRSNYDYGFARPSPSGRRCDDVQIAADAKYSRTAANKDLAEHRTALKNREPPVPDKDIDAMEAAVHKRNEELGQYDNPLRKEKLAELKQTHKG